METKVTARGREKAEVTCTGVHPCGEGESNVELFLFLLSDGL
jgi:hypothetical protein